MSAADIGCAWLRDHWSSAHDGPLEWARQERRASDNVWGDELNPGEPSEHERRQMRAES